MDKDTIRAIRAWLGMSQQEFADYLGVGKATVSMVESGKREVTDYVKFKIAKKFEVTDDFLEYKERYLKLPS